METIGLIVAFLFTFIGGYAIGSFDTVRFQDRVEEELEYLEHQADLTAQQAVAKIRSLCEIE